MPHNTIYTKMKMTSGFSNKEMLDKIWDKLDRIEVRLQATHDVALKTNGKVRFLTKFTWGLAGVLVALVGWFIKNI